jgi:hypothetical protein
MILQTKHLSRRTFLRGCGAAIALPMLEIMQSTGVAATASEAPRRAAFFYIPNGVVQRSWQTESTGKGFELSPTLEPLSKMRQKISLFTRLDRIKVAGTDGHAQAGTCWISSAAPDELSPAGYPLKRTVDQIIAAKVGHETPFRSLELSCNSFQDNKESVYFDNISWYGHGHVARSMRDPQKIFERLFNIREQSDTRSVLDLVLEDARSLERQLGRLDRRKLDEYKDAIRTVEKQIVRLEGRQKQIAELALEKPAEPYVAMGREEYIQVIGDLMILAFQADLTRVASIMVAPERWGTPQLVEGVSKRPIVHHNMTHAQGNENVKKELERLDRFHVAQFARLIEKMDAIQEGERTLLDNSLFLLGSGLSSGKTHVCSDLPTVIAGSGGGAIETNRHDRHADGTPIANLWLSLVQAFGVKTDRIGDSTGPLKGFRV